MAKTKKTKIKLLDRWDDFSGTGDRYVELRIGIGGACCVKETNNGLRYILECDNGNEVYSYVGGADYPLRNLTDNEREDVIKFVAEQFETEAFLNDVEEAEYERN